MTTNEIQRVISYKRLIEKQNLSHKISHISDEELLILLNSAVLPNAISKDNLKYTLLFNLLFAQNKKEVHEIDSIFKNIKELFLLLSRTEKDLIKFGYFYGFKYYNWEYVMNLFIKNSSNPFKGKLIKQKIISSVVFKKIFPFIYNIIDKAEKNDRFPRF